MKRRLSRGDIMQLTVLGSMRDKGILTADEFAREKALVLTQDVRRLDAPQPPKRRWGRWLAAAAASLVVGVAAVGMSPSGPGGHSVGGHAQAHAR